MPAGAVNGGDVVFVHQIDRAFKPFRDGQFFCRFGQVGVVNDDRVQFVARRESFARAEKFRAARCAQIERFGDGQKIIRPIRFDAFDL